jgi:hypothetical protein
MGIRSAEYAMVTVRKFANSQTFANLGTSKMIALSVLDEDQIEKLDQGRTVAGMTLDDIDRMTNRELRENLRKEKENVKKEQEAREDVIAQKEAKINELDQQLRYRQPLTKEQIAKAALDALTRDYTVALGEVNSSLRNALALLVKAEKIEDVKVQQLSDWLNQFDIEMTAFTDLCQTWTNEIDNAGPVKDWRISDLPDLSEGGEA